MKRLFLVGVALVIASTAFAGTDPADVNQPVRTTCDMQYVAYDWNFADSDWGFTTASCDQGGAPVWAYGATTIPGAPGNVWGTVLAGNYPNDSGEGLVAPSFMVGTGSYLMEIGHYFDCETNYDGMNVKVNGTVVTPMGGYTGTISTSTSFYAWCVDMQPGWTGHDAQWRTDCFDLSAYNGQSVEVEFDFGSDSSVQYPGWYIAYVMVGGDTAVPVVETSWGKVKSLYH